MNGDDEEDLGSEDTMDNDAIIFMYLNLQFFKNMVDPTARSQAGCVKIAINTYKFSAMNIGSNIYFPFLYLCKVDT